MARQADIFAVAAVAVALATSAPAWAATRDGGPVDRPGTVAAPSDVVRDIQQTLTKMGYYSGVVDGRMNNALRDAIEAYQRAVGRKVDGKASRELAEHMNTQDKVGAMLKRLDAAREEKIAAAREALMQKEQTRRLLEGDKKEVANPTRDASACFAKPTQTCLLDEAVESAKGIFKSELRDWAYGEILVSQAKAGMIDEAISTVRRIGDARLIIVALRDISRALAQEARVVEARDVAELIPDLAKRLEALTAIAEILSVKGNAAGARDTAEAIIKEARALEEPLKRIGVNAQMAVVLAKAGDGKRAIQVLEDGQAILRAGGSGLGDAADRGAALRHIASAFADIGEPDRALALLPQVGGDYDKIAVLMSAAKAQAARGNADAALATASWIDSDRYKSVAFGRVAAEMARLGDEEKAFALISHAMRLLRGIDLPYARSYSAGQLTLSLTDIGLRYGEKAFTRAIEASTSIDNDQLRAHALWSIASAQARMALPKDAEATQRLARTATDRIGSSMSQVWMLADIASERIASGEGERAKDALEHGLTIAKGISNPWGRARALARLAATLYEFR
jgi:peptidoglycan hydrolase-like protein with peptidoglycan-binding domain